MTDHTYRARFWRIAITLLVSFWLAVAAGGWSALK